MPDRHDALISPSIPWRHRRSSLLLACIILAALADWFFYRHPLGWLAAPFMGIATALLALRAPALWRSMVGRTSLALAGFLLLTLVEEPTPLAILMAALALGTLSILARSRWTPSLQEWFRRWLSLLVTLPFRLHLDGRIAARWFRHHPASRPAALRAIFRWIIPLLAGGVFAILFAIANPIIQQWAREALHRLWTLLDWLPLVVPLRRVILWLTVGLCAYGLLRFRRRGRPQWIHIPPVQVPRPTHAHLPIIRCLIVFNLVFALQSSLDILYLYGGAALPPGMTYAHYAHRGAYPLVATALLAGLFVLATFRTGGAAHRSPLARRLVFLWIAQNVFLLISTVWRLWLYVDAYSLTRLRLAAILWIALVALGFLWMIWKILAARSNAWLWQMNAAALLAVLYLCAFINFPGLIADFNVRHCRALDPAAAPLDVAYLESLGPPALPALDWISPRAEPRDQHALAAARRHLQSTLAESLADWHAWTYRRHRLAAYTNAYLP